MKDWQKSIIEQEKERQRSRESTMNRVNIIIMIIFIMSVLIELFTAVKSLNAIPNFKEIQGTAISIELSLFLEIGIIFALLFILFYVFVMKLVPWIISIIKHTDLYMDMNYPFNRDSEIQKAYWNDENTIDALTGNITNILYLMVIAVTIWDFQFDNAKIDWRVIFVMFATAIVMLSTVDAFFKQRFLIKTIKMNDYSNPSRGRLLFREAIDQLFNLLWAGAALFCIHIFDYVKNYYCNKKISVGINRLIAKIPSNNGFSNFTQNIIKLQKTFDSISISGYYNFLQIVFLSVIGWFTLVYLIIPLFRIGSKKRAISYLITTIAICLIINYYQLIYSWGLGLPFLIIGGIIVSLASQTLMPSFRKE